MSAGYQFRCCENQDETDIVKEVCLINKTLKFLLFTDKPYNNGEFS